MKKIKELGNKKWFKTLKIVIKTFIIVAVAGFIISVCLQRFSGNKISFLNYRMFTVITGSMKPKYDVGDVLIAKEVDPSSIKIGDTISYLGDENDFTGKVITHEVVGIDKDENGKYVFRAKGLANLVEDPKVSEDQLYGKVVYKSLILSTIYSIVGTKLGMFLFIIIPLIIVIGSEILSTLLSKEEKRRANISEE